MSDWKAELEALWEEDQATVKRCARKFGVPLMVAYFRAKELGLLKPPPSQPDPSLAPNTLPPATAEAQGVKIKPLEWIDGVGLSYAQTNLVACYSVWDVEDGLWLCSLVDGQFPTMEAAKDAAQADYERRILSALSLSQIGEEGK